MMKGIDISKWQGNVDFKKVKEDGIEFVILRSSYRQTTDQMFYTYVNGCKKNDIPIIGIYHFLYALNEEQALQEAMFCVSEVLKTGLTKDTIIFSDFEYDSVKSATNKGVTLGKKECNRFTQIFCEYVESQGFKAGIYSNIDYYKNWYDHDLLSKYCFWLADYKGEADYKCLIQQYTSKGHVNGIETPVDMNYYYGNEVKQMSDRQKPVNYLKKYIGIKEGSEGHKAIIKVFNDSNLCTRYEMTTKDSYCATAVSAAFIASGLTAIFPCVECSCGKMIDKAKKAGLWIENDNYVPNTGDVIMYDWQDSGVGDNQGYPDHVGIVSYVNNDTIKVVEGNKNDTVAYRDIKVNSKFIRGFIVPKYKEEVKTEPVKQELNKTSKWIGKVTAFSLNVRKWAGKDNDTCSFSPLRRNELVSVCDIVKAPNGDNWYYIRNKDGKFGFVNSDFVTKL